MSSLEEDFDIFGFINFPAGQDIDGLDAGDVSAIRTFFGNTSAGQMSALFDNDYAGQDPSERHLLAGGNSALDDDGNKLDDSNDVFSVSSSEDAAAEQTRDVPDEICASQPLGATGNPNSSKNVELEEAPTPEAWTELKGFESATFCELDDYGKQTIVVNYINDHPAWFYQAFAQDDNIQDLLKQHPQEVTTFLQNNAENPQLRNTLVDCSKALIRLSEASDPTSESKLLKLLTRHKDDGTLGKIFEKHHMILAHALKSIDDSDVLFKFFNKHKRVVADWLERHKNIDVLAAFFDKYPAAITMILDEERAIVENFLRDVPEALHTYLDANPNVVKRYLASKSSKFQGDMREFISDEASSHHPTKRPGNQSRSYASNGDANAVNTSAPRRDESPSVDVDRHLQTLSPHTTRTGSSRGTQDEIAHNRSPDMGNQSSVPSVNDSGTKNKDKHTDKTNDGQLVGKEDSHDFGNVDRIHDPFVKPVESLRTTTGHEDDWTEIWAERDKESKYNKTTSADIANSDKEHVEKAKSKSEIELESDSESEFEGDDNQDDDFEPTHTADIAQDEDSEEYNSEDSDCGDEFTTPKVPFKPKKTSSAGRAAAIKSKKTLSQKAKNHKKAPKNKPRVWTQAEQDSIIRHMLAIRDEGVIDTEERFDEAADRMKQELGITRTGVSVKNFWSRTGREKSGYDERKEWNRSNTLATSLQGKKAAAKAKASPKAGKEKRKREVEEEEEREEEKEKFDLDVECRAFANGTRQK